MTENITETKEAKNEQPTISTPLVKHPRKSIPRHVIFICGIIALLLLGFVGGQAFERARIRHFIGWQDNYERNFFGNQPRGTRGMMVNGNMMGGPFRSHAIVGTILSINNSTLSIQDNDGNVEQSVNFSDSTVIQKNNGKGNSSDLQTNQRVAIFGRPTNNGQIEASLVRILGTANSPETITTPTPSNQAIK